MLSSLIDAEPGLLIAPGGEKFAFKDGITAKFNLGTQETPSDIVQDAGRTWDDVTIDITGTPYGEYENLTVLYPYSAYRRNQNIFGADAAWKIHTTSGRLLTFHRAAVTGYASLNLAPNKTIFGSGFKLTAIRKDNVSWSTANSLYTESALAFTDYSSFDPTLALKVDAAAVLGALATPWSDIETEDGWEIGLNLNLQPLPSSRTGTIQMLFQGETATAKCSPLNVTQADIIALVPIQGGTARRGKRVASGNNLVLTGAGGSPVVTLTSVQVLDYELRYGNKHRVGMVEFGAGRIYTAGVPQPLFTLS